MQTSANVNEWINHLKPGMTKEEIEKSKPEAVTIYWNKPIQKDSSSVEYDLRYKDRTDFAPTPFYLVFEKGVYKMCGGRN